MAELDVVRRLNVAIPLRDGVTLAAGFARAGYVSVFAGVRGRGDSDGVFEPYRNDGPDGAEVVAWAAAQEWRTGDVATWGASYGGRIQWLTALQRGQPCARWCAW